MRAVTWHGRRHVRVEEVGDPGIEETTDAVIRVTSSGICGSDLHLYDVLVMFMSPGDILGHEAIGIVEAKGADVTHVDIGDRVVVPFNISCGRCFMCDRQLHAQCETTQVTKHGKGAALFGYTRLYGQIPGAQAQYLRVPQAHFGPIKVPHGPPDEQFVYLSDVLPTAWQAVMFADVPPDGSVAILGLGPIGQMCSRIAPLLGAGRVIGVDLVEERRAMAERHGVEVLDPQSVDVVESLRDLCDGRGPDSVIDAVGMEAHGAPVAAAMQRAAGMLPGWVSAPLTEQVGVDRLSALHTAIRSVRRGGTVSITGVYGGNTDPMPMMELFDKGVQLRMGQTHVRRWTGDILPLLEEGDRLGVGDFTTHVLPLDEAPRAYDMFQKKADGAVKVLLRP